MNAIFTGKSLYAFALVLILVTEAWLFYLFSQFILAGEGMGIYGVFLYLLALMISALLWAISYRQNRSKTKTLVFWLAALAMMPIVLSQPVWWSAPAV